MSTATALITAEEFRQLPDDGRKYELVRGEVVEMNQPAPRHGQICTRVVYLGCRYNEQHDCMHVLSNDTGVVTERNPDTVRGPDVWFVRYSKVAKGRLPDRYLDVVADVAFEVVSPSDSWADILTKASEFVNAGVQAVCVLDPSDDTAHMFYPDAPNRTLSADDELTFPELLPGFSIKVEEFFE